MQSQKSRLENVLTILPQGHDEALKRAFYNIAALIFVIVVSSIAVAIYYILQPFLRPLLWALLWGTVLFPFKHHLATTSKHWLKGLHTSGTPLCIGIFILPFTFINKLIDCVIETCWMNKKVILLCCVCVPTSILCVHLWPIPSLTSLLFILLEYSASAIHAFSSFWIWSMVAGFLVILIIFPSDRLNPLFKIISTLLWVAVALHLSITLNSPLLFFLSFITVPLALLGLYTQFASLKKSPSTARNESDTSNETLKIEEGTEDDKEKDKEKDKEESKHANTAIQQESKESISFTRSDSTNLMFPNRSFSDSCLVVVVWSLLLIHFFMHTFLLSIIPFMAVLVTLKMLGNYLEVWVAIEGWAKGRVEAGRRYLEHPRGRLSILVPKPVSWCFKTLLMGDSKMIAGIEASIDKLCSALIIFLLLLSLIIFFIASGLEVHKESMHLVQVSSNIFNKTQHPSLAKWLPEDDVVQNAVDSMVNNAYVYGREWIVNQLKLLLHGQDGDQCHIEKQVLKLWDTMYNAWTNKNKTSSIHEAFTMRILNHTTLPSIKKRLNHYRPSIVDFIKDNIDPLLTLLKSVWSVLVSNVALSLQVVFSTLSLVFGGGTAILNTLLSMVIFLTTLFYLLSCSGGQYKPVEVLSSLGLSQSNNHFKFARAFEDAIGSVFVVSLKMGAFYGLYTWFTHVVFSVQIIFIPSALAALLAVVPLVGTYVACFPGIVELWLINGQPLHALLLFLAHYLPTLVIDTAFYSEMKGGHPLLTGLAIIGGMYWMGLEGAIIGPILLCCFVVAVHMYQAMIRSV